VPVAAWLEIAIADARGVDILTWAGKTISQIVGGDVGVTYGFCDHGAEIECPLAMVLIGGLVTSSNG
jgi:hypothetical protein